MIAEISDQVDLHIRKFNEGRHEYTITDIQKLIKEFYTDLRNKAIGQKINPSIPSLATVFIAENIPDYNLSWVENIK